MKTFYGLMSVGSDFPDMDERGGVQRQCVIAAPSQAKVAEILKVSLSFIKGNWTVTGNEEDIAVANSEPGVAFFRGLDNVKRDGAWWGQWYRQVEGSWESVDPLSYSIGNSGREL